MPGVLFPKRVWAGLQDGSVTVAFRYWRRPTVKAGGTLHCPVGLLAIDAVDRVGLRAVTAAEARAAGAAGRAALLDELARRRRDGTALYRVRFHFAGEDPRRALREAPLSGADVEALRERMARMDRASLHGPWTRAVLELIRDHPATLAADLAALRGRAKFDFKADVRKLKALGLTESLPVGYRLSPRGEAFLRAP